MSIGTLLSEKSQLDALIMGLEEQIRQDSSSEVMEYFLHNKNLVLNCINDSEIDFSVWRYLESYDEDQAERVIENRRSVAYNPGHGKNIDDDDMYLLLSSIFIERKLHVRFCAHFRLSYVGTIEAVEHSSYGCEFNGCMPNPHLDKYNCMQENRTEVEEIISNRFDFIVAIEQCAASCANLNFGDSTVMREFIDGLHGYGCFHKDEADKCIELPDGRVVRPKEAVEWLKEEKTEEEA